VSVAYIVSNNGKLEKDNEVLLYSDHQGTRAKLLPNKITHIVIYGAVEITGPALFLIAAHRIQVDFFHKNGRFNSRIEYEGNKNTILRHRQHILYEEPRFTLPVAKSIVIGKIHNEYLFMQRLQRRRNPTHIDGIVKNLSRLMSSVSQCTSVDKVRGVEGMAAKEFFSGYAYALDGVWANSFHGRNKNPPLDPVNSVLSFLYTVVCSKIANYIEAEGLDPSIGSLHALSYGRKSLAFDLVEEFRTPIVDTLTASLFNLGILKQTDFRREVTSSYVEDEESGELKLEEEDCYGVFLTEDGMKKVLTQLEKKLGTEHKYPLNGKTMTYEKILHAQVVQYKNVVSGVMNSYRPLVVT